MLAITYRVVLRQLTSRGRIIALTLLALVSIVAGFALGQADAELDDAVSLIASLGFAVVVPVVALVFGGAAIGDLRDDKTLVYFWLRPMDRWPVVVGAALAAMTLTAPITLIPVVLASVLTGAGSGIVTGTIIAGVVAVIAYVVRVHPVRRVAQAVHRVGPRVHPDLGGFHRPGRSGRRPGSRCASTPARSSSTAPVPISTSPTSPSPSASIVPLVVAVVALVVAAWRLGNQEID